MFDNTKSVASVELKEFQKEAVVEISDAVVHTLNRDADDPNRSNKIVLDAPTGSGKTIMISQILHLSAKDQVTILLTPGAGSLGEQTFRSLEKNLARDEEITVRELDLEMLAQDPSRGLVAVANWESLTTRDKKTGEYITRNTRDSEQLNLFDFLSKMAVADIDLLVVIDEAHYGASKDALAIKSFLEDMRSTLVAAGGKPFVTLEASATPLLGLAANFTYQVSRDDVIESGLMRKRGFLNAGVKKILDETEETLEVEQVLLRGAWAKRNELDDLYSKAGSTYSPLMAVQIPNSRPGNEAMERVEEFFAAKNITKENGRLAIFTSGLKTDQLTEISSPDSPIEVLIYKQAIATGWDCPRAQVLVGFRHIKSRVFTTQNIGRFTRTTEARHYPIEVDELNSFYVYSNLSDLGVNSTSDERGAAGGTEVVVPQESQHDVKEFNDYNLPFSVYRHTKQDSLKGSVVGREVNKVMAEILEDLDFDKRDGEYLLEADWTTGEWSGGKGDSIDTDRITTRVSRSELEEWVVYSKDILAEVRNAGDHGNDGRLAEMIAKKTLAYFSAKSKKKKGDILGALVIAENAELIRSQIEEMLKKPLFEDLRTEITAGEETPVPATNREWRYRGNLALADVMYTSNHNPDFRVNSRLAKYALYALPAVAEGVDPAAYWQEGLSGPERAFEQHLLHLMDQETLKLSWIHKNAPFRNGDNFSVGVLSKNENTGVVTASNFFPDYVLMVEKDGQKFPMIIEIKDDLIGMKSPHLLVRVKAARTYSEKTGVPFLVLSRRKGTEEFAILDPESEGHLKDAGSFSNYLRTLEEANIKTFNPLVGQEGFTAPEGMEWMKSLGL